MWVINGIFYMFSKTFFTFTFRYLVDDFIKMDLQVR